MQSGTQMKRSNAVRNDEVAPHDATNPFCAVHPDLSSHQPSMAPSHLDGESQNFRRVQDDGMRAHVPASHVMLVKRKKK